MPKLSDYLQREATAANPPGQQPAMVESAAAAPSAVVTDSKHAAVMAEVERLRRVYNNRC